MNSRLPPLWTECDLDALEHNYREVERLMGVGTKFIGSVKGDGYGHGAAKVAEILKEHNAYAVMTGRFEDAKRIREAGVKIPIAMFAGYTPDEIPELLEFGLIPTIVDMQGAEAVSRAAQSQTSIYIKVDAGLGRLGMGMAEAVDFIERVAALPNIKIECVYTHLPFFDTSGREWAQARLSEFDEVLTAARAKGIEIPITQARASSGVLAGLKDSCNSVCVGHLLYGLVPTVPELAKGADLRPVLKAIRTRLIHVRRHAAGSNLAIGQHYGIESPKTIGVLPLGIADGMRMLSPDRAAYVLFRGRRVKVVGVSYEHMIVDLEGTEGGKVGEEVVIVGESGEENISLQEFAESLGCTDLEVLSGFSGRMDREYTVSGK